MKLQRTRILAALFALLFTLSAVILPVAAAESSYTVRTDIPYTSSVVGGKTILHNWGKRGEVIDYMTPYAEDYYVGNAAFAVLSAQRGGSTQSNAPESDLYRALHDLMAGRHTYINDYGETRQWYALTDCVENDSSQLVSFYSGQLHTSVWDGGSTWNREHTWPNSKGMNGDDENDIMMLRPTIKTENGSRGNKAYGEGAGYFDPGAQTRGDCARIALYVYTRWGNTGRMWGQSGMFESLDILLKWMQEDPVDSWEMGRNDAVQSITGVRNVFIDYPEYAWLLFGVEYPVGSMVTPSGEMDKGPGVVPIKATLSFHAEIAGYTYVTSQEMMPNATVTLPTMVSLSFVPETVQLPNELKLIGWSTAPLEKTVTPKREDILSAEYLVEEDGAELYAVWLWRDAETGTAYYGYDPLAKEGKSGCASSLVITASPCLLLALGACVLIKKKEQA